MPPILLVEYFEELEHFKTQSTNNFKINPEEKSTQPGHIASCKLSIHDTFFPAAYCITKVRKFQLGKEQCFHLIEITQMLLVVKGNKFGKNATAGLYYAQ